MAPANAPGSSRAPAVKSMVLWWVKTLKKRFFGYPPRECSTNLNLVRFLLVLLDQVVFRMFRVRLSEPFCLVFVIFESFCVKLSMPFWVRFWRFGLGNDSVWLGALGASKGLGKAFWVFTGDRGPFEKEPNISG